MVVHIHSQYNRREIPSKNRRNSGATGDSGTLYNEGVVSNANPAIVALADDPGNTNGWWSNLFVELDQTEQILNKGFIIEAESEVYVSVRMNSDGQQYQAGALVSKGKSGLGTRFWAGMLQKSNCTTRWFCVSHGHRGSNGYFIQLLQRY